MKKIEDLPYLEKKEETQELTKEDMIYGGGETLSDKRKKTEETKGQLILE